MTVIVILWRTWWAWWQSFECGDPVPAESKPPLEEVVVFISLQGFFLSHSFSYIHFLFFLRWKPPSHSVTSSAAVNCYPNHVRMRDILTIPPQHLRAQALCASTALMACRFSMGEGGGVEKWIEDPQMCTIHNWDGGFDTWIIGSA